MTTIKFVRYLTLATLTLTGSLHAAPIAHLFEQPLIADIKISPSGNYLAVKVFHEGSHHVRFLDRKTFAVLGNLYLSGKAEVGDYFWANDDRIVAEVYGIRTGSERPRFYGELFAINKDGTEGELIFGFRSGDQQTGTLMKQRTDDRAWGALIDMLPDDKDRILISATPYSRDQGERPTAQYLNIYNGKDVGTVKRAKHAFGSFYTDKNGELRLVTSYLEDRTQHIESLPNKETGWVELPSTNFGLQFQPIAITNDLTGLFALDNASNDRLGLHRLALDGSSYQEIYTHAKVDVTSINSSSDGESVYAMRVDNGYPSYLIFDKEHKEAQLFRKLLQTFPGHLVNITSHSRDGVYSIVRTRTDVDPGSFYLYDGVAGKMSFLFKALPNVDPKQLTAMEPVEFESFDGQQVAGYFTPGTTKAGTLAPLVVLLHGGPRARDYWGFNSVTHALTTNGYSVLQINFRGSSGYGETFLKAGNRQWGDKVQQDIIAGTRWAIAQGKAQQGKICTMGASFGAYSALQSAILAPDLYACVIGNAGIYDLTLLYKEGDIETRYGGEAYLEEVVGRDENELKRFSPVYNVAALNAPMFIAHGQQDERAPIEHAEKLKKELDKSKKPYQWYVQKREAHGFYNKENQIDYMEAVLKFLDKHLN